VGKKYIDPIIAATWSEDGAIHDVCKALSPRFREPNSIVSPLISFHSVSRGLTPLQVVFKALIVLHTMIRNGATDNVLQYLSSSEVLRLKNVAGGQWEGVNHVLVLHLTPLSIDLNQLTPSFQVTMHPEISNITRCILTRAFAHTAT
jgi:hypothetical protein